MTSKEIELVLSFLEESRDYGPSYAEERLWQRWNFSRYQVKEVGRVAEDVGRQIERKYRSERYWYLIVIGLGIVASLVNLGVVFNVQLPDAVRLAFCFIMPVSTVLVISYWRYFHEAGKRRDQTRKDLDALYSAFGGLLQA
ncbi:MAG: hypothetical protein EG828_13745 [Deltaproteobacteria bacterium]|nr:hypothetical protein [Deltaproteobacteria bacterium]